MSTLIIGAHALTGVSAMALAEGLTCGAEFPLQVEIASHAPFNLSLPEAKVFLRPGESRTFSIQTVASLTRMISSAAQIAELNGSAKLITLSKASLEPKEPGEEAGEKVVVDKLEPQFGDTASGAGQTKAAPAASKRTGSRKSGSSK